MTPMRETGWTYIRKNMHTDRPVACFVNKNGRTVFHVIGIRNGYVTVDLIKGIESYFISYSDARKMNSEAEENQPDAGDVLFAALKHACERIEADYHDQVARLMEQFA